MTKESRENEELKELMEAINFNSKMAMQKAGHVGLLVMAAYLANKNKDKANKLPKKLLVFSMVLLLLDDIEYLVHAVREGCKENRDSE